MEMPLRPGTIVPPFTLPDRRDAPLARSSFRAKAGLLILFLPPRDEAAAGYLDGLAREVAGWPREQAALVVAGSRQELDRLGGDPPLRLLYDAGGAARQRFLPPEAPGGWFITDRYGELYAQGAVAAVADLPPPAHFSEWMQFVGMRCGG